MKILIIITAILMAGCTTSTINKECKAVQDSDKDLNLLKVRELQFGRQELVIKYNLTPELKFEVDMRLLLQAQI